MNRTRLRSPLAEFLLLTRFSLVGVLATALYLVCATVLELTTALAAGFIHVLALAGSLLFSYFGHFTFTYRMGGGHRTYPQRFLVVTCLIAVTATLLHRLAIQVGGSSFVSYVVVTAYYPLASITLHHVWTFLRGKAPD